MRVTEYNVGQWCMSEDECIAAGINFAAYERGVSDAAQAFGRNPPPTLPLLTDEDWQAIVDDPSLNFAFIPGKLRRVVDARIAAKLAAGVKGLGDV